MGYANTKYKTKKRKANVGERILITDAGYSGGYYRNGDVLTVIKDRGNYGVDIKEYPDAPFVVSSEYEVIIEAKPSKNERISLLESQVAELQAKVEALQKPSVTERFPITTKMIDDLLSYKRPPNKERKAVIERAKAFVTETTTKNHKDVRSQSLRFGAWFVDEGEHVEVTVKAEFIVNVEKRTVVALIRRLRTNEIRAKAIAKCAPDDVFNADIGKAIALGRALGLDVSEFENAVKPTEVVVGHKLQSNIFSDNFFEVTRTSDDRAYLDDSDDYYLFIDFPRAYRIANDTKAKY